MNRPAIVLTATILALAQTISAQPFIGDPVPPLLDEVRWLQGVPVREFDDGRVYVLEFWATWCPPCYPLLSHLSELQDRYADRGLTVVGIAVGTDVGLPLPRFLEKEGPHISYTIAQPVDESRLKAQLVHPSIMDPEELSLPFVMIVDRQGRLAWTSDPRGSDDQLDTTLAAVLDGSFDVVTYAESAGRGRTLSDQARPQLERARDLGSEGRLAEAAEIFLPVAEALPREHATEAVALFQKMLCSGDDELAATFGRELRTRVLVDRVSELVQAERAILALPVDGKRDLELAEAMTRQALELKGGNHPDFLFELAKVLAAQDRMEEAESFRQQASSAARKQGWQASYVDYISTIDLDLALRRQSSGFEGTCKVIAKELS